MNLKKTSSGVFPSRKAGRVPRGIDLKVMSPSPPAMFPDMDKRQSFSVSEVAWLFGITVQAIHQWIAAGRIRYGRRASIRGRYLISRAEVVRILRTSGREVRGLWEHPRRRVLIIDDDLGIRRLAAAAARNAGTRISLRTACCAEDGLLCAARFRPELIFLDAVFPEGKMRGDQALAFIRGTKDLRRLQVIAMVNSRGAGEGMLRGGADAILLKPFGLSEFRLMLAGSAATVGRPECGEASRGILKIQ